MKLNLTLKHYEASSVNVSKKHMPCHVKRFLFQIQEYRCQITPRHSNPSDFFFFSILVIQYVISIALTTIVNCIPELCFPESLDYKMIWLAAHLDNVLQRLIKTLSTVNRIQRDTNKQKLKDELTISESRCVLIWEF